MSQQVLLAPGVSAAMSTAFTVAAGFTATVGIYSATRIDEVAFTNFQVLLATPGAENVIDYLGNQKRQVVVGPGTYRVQRREYQGHPFGVFVET